MSANHTPVLSQRVQAGVPPHRATYVFDDARTHRADGVSRPTFRRSRIEYLRNFFGIVYNGLGLGLGRRFGID